MAKIKMMVDGEVFPTKAALLKRLRAILHAPEIGQEVTEQETRFLASLIENYHPEPDLKLGVGVKTIRVEPNDYGGRGFYLERLDGSVTDFSFMACLNNPTPWADFLAGCRNAVFEDVQQYKKAQFETGPIVCALSGLPLTLETAHVDHVPPKTFVNMVKVFLVRSKRQWKAVAIEPTHDDKEGSWIADQVFVDEFRAFHKKEGQFRLVTRKANLSDSKKEWRNIRDKLS